MAQIIKQSLVQRAELEQLCESTPTSFNEEQIELLKKEAYQQGYLKGQTEAKELAYQQLNELKNRLEQMLLAIPLAVEQNRLTMQQELTSMCLFIVQRYFVAQKVDPQILETQINQLLTQINNQQNIELHLHPNDIQLVQKGLIKLSAVNNEITIKNEEALAVGGFMVKTSHGMFDASVEKQIDKLKQYLMNITHEEHQ